MSSQYPAQFANCTHVTAACPVKATLYGYVPNLAGNTIFTVVFAVLLLAQLLLCWFSRNFIFTAWVCCGLLLELIGYIGRLIMRHNVWDDTGLEIQIITLVLGPSFLAAGIYLTLKSIVRQLGQTYSILAPKRYPIIFVSCDAVSIAVQAAGGALAAGGGHSLRTAGSDLIMVGIAFQVATMAVFLGLVCTFWRRRSLAKRAATLSADSRVYGPERRKFVVFLWAIAVAYVFILIRCIYRLHEFAGGWGNSRMRDEASFLICDGAMIAIASVALTIGHPGILVSGHGSHRTDLTADGLDLPKERSAAVPGECDAAQSE